MNISVPGLGDILPVVKRLPDMFDALVDRLDHVVELLEETNELLRSNHG